VLHDDERRGARAPRLLVVAHECTVTGS
jgi:hypothetical protein